MKKERKDEESRFIEQKTGNKTMVYFFTLPSTFFIGSDSALLM